MEDSIDCNELERRACESWSSQSITGLRADESKAGQNSFDEKPEEADHLSLHFSQSPKTCSQTQQDSLTLQQEALVSLQSKLPKDAVNSLIASEPITLNDDQGHLDSQQSPLSNSWSQGSTLIRREKLKTPSSRLRQSSGAGLTQLFESESPVTLPNGEMGSSNNLHAQSFSRPSHINHDKEGDDAFYEENLEVKKHRMHAQTTAKLRALKARKPVVKMDDCIELEGDSTDEDSKPGIPHQHVAVQVPQTVQKAGYARLRNSSPKVEDFTPISKRHTVNAKFVNDFDSPLSSAFVVKKAGVVDENRNHSIIQQDTFSPKEKDIEGLRIFDNRADSEGNRIVITDTSSSDAPGAVHYSNPEYDTRHSKQGSQEEYNNVDSSTPNGTHIPNTATSDTKTSNLITQSMTPPSSSPKHTLSGTIVPDSDRNDTQVCESSGNHDQPQFSSGSSVIPKAKRRRLNTLRSSQDETSSMTTVQSSSQNSDVGRGSADRRNKSYDVLITKPRRLRSREDKSGSRSKSPSENSRSTGANSQPTPHSSQEEDKQSVLSSNVAGNTNAVSLHETRVLAFFMNAKGWYGPATIIKPYYEASGAIIPIVRFDNGSQIGRTKAIKSLELRAGDEVKFANASYRIISLKSSENPSELCDVFGNDTAVISKLGKKNKSKSPIEAPVSQLWLTATQFGKLEGRDVTALPRFTTKPVFHEMGFVLSGLPTTHPEYSRKQVANLIRSHGGVTFDNDDYSMLFSNSSKSDQKSFPRLHVNSDYGHLKYFCTISTTYARTPKHLQSLALGFPCLAVRFILDSVSQDQIADWRNYLLPAGESLYLAINDGPSTKLSPVVKSMVVEPFSEDETIVERLDRRKGLLYDSRVIFFFDQKSNVKELAFILQCMGAQLVCCVNKTKELQNAVETSHWDLILKTADSNAASSVSDLLPLPCLDKEGLIERLILGSLHLGKAF